MFDLYDLSKFLFNNKENMLEMLVLLVNDDSVVSMRGGDYMKKKHYVLRNGIVQHEGDLLSCQQYIWNSQSLYSVTGQTICQREGKKFVPVA